MQQKTCPQNTYSDKRMSLLLGTEYMKTHNSYNDFIHLVREGNSKHIPDELQQKAIRVLKSNKCNHDNLSQFSSDQIDEFYKQVVQKLTFEDYQGIKLIDPQITKSLYIVLLGEVIIYAPKLNQEEQSQVQSEKEHIDDEKQIKSLLNLNLNDEYSDHHKQKSHGQTSIHHQLNSQDELTLKNYEFHKKIISGQIFGDVKIFPELPKRHIAKTVGEVILAKVQKKEMENILRTNMKELYFKVNQLSKLLPNINNKSIIQLSKQLVQKIYMKGQIIYQEGSVSDNIFFIKEGQVTFIKKYISQEKPDPAQNQASIQNNQTQHEDSTTQLRKHKINQKEIELSKIGVGQVFGNDEVFLEIPRQMTTKVSSVNLEVYILNKDLIFQFLQKINMNQQENGKSYLDSLKKHSLNKQGFYENRLNVNTKKIQNIVEFQRKISSPQIQRGMSSIANDLVETAQLSQQKSQNLEKQTIQSFNKYPSNISFHDKQIQIGGGSPQNSQQNLLQLDTTYKNVHQEYLTPVIQRDLSFKQSSKKEEQILTRPHSNSQTDGISASRSKDENEFVKLKTIIKSSADINNVSLNNKSNNNSSLKNQNLTNQTTQSRKNSKQLAATDEIQIIVQNNYKFMIQSNSVGKKFGFENPLFQEMDQNNLSRIRKINYDYQKMKNPKKYREQPIYKQNQTAQKLISNMLNLTKKSSQSLHNQACDSTNINNTNLSNTQNIQIQSLVGSPRQQENPNTPKSNVSYNNDNILNQSTPNSPQNSSFDKQANKINIKKLHKSKFQISNNSPLNKYPNCNADSPIQVNGLISSAKEIPLNANQKKISYVDSPILSPQNQQQSFETYLSNPNSRFVQQQYYIKDKQQYNPNQQKISNQNFNTTTQSMNIDAKDNIIESFSHKLDTIRFGNNNNYCANQSTKLIDHSVEYTQNQNGSINLSRNKFDNQEQNQNQSSEQIFPESIQSKVKLAHKPLKISIPSSEALEKQKEDINSFTKSHSVYYFKHNIKASPKQIKNPPLNLSINGKIPQSETSVDYLNKSRPGTAINTPANHDKSSLTHIPDNNQLHSPIKFYQNASFSKSQSLGKRNFNEKCNHKAVFNQTLQSILQNQPFEKQMNSYTNYNNGNSQLNSTARILQQDLKDHQNAEQSYPQINQQLGLNSQNSQYLQNHTAFFNNFSKTSQPKKDYFFIQNLPQNNLIYQKKSSSNIGENLNYSISSSNQILQHNQLFTCSSNKQDKNSKSIKVKPIFCEKSQSPQKKQFINYHTQHKTQSKSSSRINHFAMPSNINPNIQPNSQTFVQNSLSPKFSQQKERFKAIYQPN